MNLLSLSTYGANFDQLSHPYDDYLVLKASTHNPFTLSSDVMLWDDQLYLVDLRKMHFYWNKVALGRQKPIREILLSLLKSQGECFRGIFCSHPWHGILHLNLLIEDGLFSQEEFKQKKIYSQLKISSWIECAQFLSRNHLPLQRRSSFEKNLQHFSDFCNQHEGTTIYDIPVSSIQAFERRFGKSLSSLWFLTKREDIPIDFFPWVPLLPSKVIQAERSFDFPLNNWDLLGYEIKEGLQSILKNESLNRDQLVQEVHLKLITEDLKDHLLSASYRVPFSLLKEAPDFSGVLAQLYYQFQIFSQNEIENQVEYPSLIIGFKLSLPKVFYAEAVHLNFLEAVNSSNDYEIFTLQNLLPCPIERYQIQESAIPEKSYIPKNDRLIPDKDIHDALKRPLFYLDRPVPLSLKGDEQLTFQEKTAAPWWDTHHTAFERSYYSLLNREGQLLWIYQEEGQWFCQGLFL